MSAASPIDARKRGPAQKGQSVVARRLTRSGRFGAFRFWGAWALAFSGQLIQMVMCLIYGDKLGPEHTKQFLTQWAITLGMQTLAVEPIEICLLVFFPWLFENKYVAKLRAAYKDYMM